MMKFIILVEGKVLIGNVFVVCRLYVWSINVVMIKLYFNILLKLKEINYIVIFLVVIFF